MNRKSKAMKGLLTLAIVIALCMFFARTVQTITTPKIQRISATKGKLEQKISLTGKIYFPETESVKVENAKKLGITVDKVNVRVGYYVNEGDVLFTAYAPEYEQKLKDLEEKRDEKVKEYAAQYASGIRLRQTSAQNEMYNEMMESIGNYYTARYAVIAQANAESYTLPADEAQLTSITDGSDKLNELSAALKERSAARDAAIQQLYDLYEGKLYGVYRVGDTTFEHIKKMDELRAAIDDFDRQLLELQQLNDSLTEIKAPHAGYITSFELKAGDAYDGSKEAYAMTTEEGVPALRADISSVNKAIQAGHKVTLTQNDVSTEVDKVETDADGKKYAYIKLDSKTLKAAGGMTRLLNDGDIAMTLTYKAQKSATLLPASAVRSDGSDNYYVYIVNSSYGGLLDNGGYTVSKMTVTVLEKSDQIVAVAEDLNYREIADREDRTLTDGQAVMDYVD